MVRNIWHDAGGIGGAKNNQNTRVVGFHHGLVMFMGIVDAVWRGEDGCNGPEQLDADLLTYQWNCFNDVRRKSGTWM